MPLRRRQPRQRPISLWDRAVEGKVLAAATKLTRPLARRRRIRLRQRDRRLALLLVAIFTFPPALLLIGISIGIKLGAMEASLITVAGMLGCVLTAIVLVLNPQDEVSPRHIVLKHLRTAPFRRAAAGKPVQLPDLRQRTGQLRERFTWPLGSGFGRDPLVPSLLLLACMTFLLVGQAGGFLDRLATTRFYEQSQATTGPPDLTANAVNMQQLQAERQIANRVMLLGAAGAVLLLATAAGRAILIRRRAARRFQTCCCPDCGYGLGDMPPAIPPEQLGGFLSGPQACPECGSPWPLIPPPTRQEAVAAASRNLQPTLSHPITRPPRRSPVAAE